MTRVLHVVGSLNVGGAETWLAKGLPFVDRSRYQFDFLVHGDGPQHYREAVESRGARVFCCPEPHHFLAYARTLLRILRQNRYDVVHVHIYCFGAWVLLLAAWAGIRGRVFHSHTAEDESCGGIGRAIYFRCSRWLMRRTATVGIAVSEEAARAFFPAGWRKDPQRWCIRPIGIDLSEFAALPDREATRRELGLSRECTAIIHVGRFLPVKNHAFLVEIAGKLAVLRSNFVCVLVGDGPGRPGIEERVRASGLMSNFRFLGIREDVPQLLHACDVFVLPSHFEGFPLAYIEAQAAGLPCVISDVIAPSADLVPGRTSRQSLQSSAEIWAGEVLAAAGRTPARGVAPALRSVSIERSMQTLVECYR